MCVVFLDQQVGPSHIVFVHEDVHLLIVSNFFFVEMEPRRTRSSLISPSLKPSRNTRMVKSTRVPSHELAKLKASKPMLVIPQPVLRIHECLDENVRMAQVESNAYIALGIKEEPIDEEYDAEGRHYEDANFAPVESFTSEDCYNQDNEYEETEGMRTTRASKRKRLAGLTENTVNKEDDNNNRNKTISKKRSPKGKKGKANYVFQPIVSNVQSLAVPTAVPIPVVDNSDGIVASEQSVVETNSAKAVEGNNNVEKQFITFSENDASEKKKSQSLQELPIVKQNSVLSLSSDLFVNTEKDFDIQTEKPNVPSNDCSLNNPIKIIAVPALPEAVTEDDSFLSPTIEDEDEEDLDEEDELLEESSSSSEEESEAEITRKIFLFILIVLIF